MTSSVRIPLSEPSFGGNEWSYLKSCLDSGWVSSEGAFVERFEREFAAYLNAKYAVSTMNGTAALHLALVTLGIGPDSEVLVPSLTFVASVNPILYCGAHPVFMDSDPQTLNLDANKVADFLRDETFVREGRLHNRRSRRPIRGIMAVHLYGNPADMKPLLALSGKYDLPIIEDATESLGATYGSQMVGTLGHVGCFSFNGNKLITTGGGGMLVTADEKLAETARFLSRQAKVERDGAYHHPRVGYNYRLTNLQAALGVAQLERIDEYLRVKRDHAQIYSRLLTELPGIAPTMDTVHTENAYWLYTILVDASQAGINKDELLAHLNRCHVGARSIFHPIHSMPPYRTLQAYQIEWAPRLFGAGLNIPNSVQLTDEEIHHVVHCIRQACEHSKHGQISAKDFTQKRKDAEVSQRKPVTLQA